MIVIAIYLGKKKPAVDLYVERCLFICGVYLDAALFS